MAERARAVALAAATGLLVAAPWLEFSLYPLAWFAFVPLLLALPGARTSCDAAVLGAVAGLCANVPAFRWLIHTIDVFGGFPLPIAVFFYACLSMYSSGQFVLFSLVVRYLGPIPGALAAPCVWVALELLYPNLFPWRMANSQLEAPIMMQVGDLTGPYGLSFAIVWFAAALASCRRRGEWLPLAASLGLILAIAGYGAWRWPVVEAEIARSPALRVGLVQGNVGIREKGNAAYFDINIEKYRALSSALQSDVDVLIWPETVSHDWISHRAVMLEPDQHPFPELDRFLLFGGLGYHYGALDQPERYNSAFLVDRQGRILGRYDKQILLPFGEYLPFASLIPGLQSLSPNTGAFTAGTEARTLDLPGGASFAPLVCYEDVPSAIAREMTQLGANVLMTIFNDAWFGDSMAPYQHEAIAVWRAIENRRYFVRVGNAGDTGVVDPLGRIVDRLALFEVGTLQQEIRLLSTKTFYTRFGDVAAWVVVAVVFLALCRKRFLGSSQQFE